MAHAVEAEPTATESRSARCTLRRIATSGIAFAWIAVIIYAASNSIVSLLVGIGEANPVADDRNAITYHNLLLLGSLISAVPMAVMFRRDLTRASLRTLTRRDWGMLTLSAFLSSALTPGLFFFALANTTVTNVVLISRIEPPLFLLASWIVLNERFSRRTMCAGLIALTGAVVMIAMRDSGGLDALGKGEWATVAATFSYILSTLVARAGLRDVPLGIFSVYRTVAGAAIYFGLISVTVGPDAFTDILSPVLWQWIWVYAGIVIVLGQLAWSFALKEAAVEDLSLATSFSPLAAILIAMLILREDPGAGFLPGAALICLAILLGQIRAMPGNPAGETEMHQPGKGLRRSAEAWRGWPADFVVVGDQRAAFPGQRGATPPGITAGLAARWRAMRRTFDDLRETSSRLNVFPPIT